MGFHKRGVRGCWHVAGHISRCLVLRPGPAPRNAMPGDADTEVLAPSTTDATDAVADVSAGEAAVMEGDAAEATVDPEAVGGEGEVVDGTGATAAASDGSGAPLPVGGVLLNGMHFATAGDLMSALREIQERLKDDEELSGHEAFM
jgi:hypothetical protein